MQKNLVLKNALIISIISLGLLAAGELTLRLIYPEKVVRPSGPRNVNELAYEFNENYLVGLKPNLEKTYVRDELNGSDVIKWQTNAHSFRGPDLKSNPGTRIVVYGDSNIQARFSSRENTYVFKLEEYLQAAGIGNVEVVNAGVIGFGPDQSLLRFGDEAEIIGPDLVIFHIFTENDFGDIVRNRLFQLDANGVLERTDHILAVDQSLTPGDSGERERRQTLRDLVSSSLLLMAMGKLGRMLSGKEKEIYQEKVLTTFLERTQREYAIYKAHKSRKVSHFRDYYDIDVALGPERESSRIKVDLMAAILEKANEFAASKGIELLVLIQPSRTDIQYSEFSINYQYLEKQPGYARSNLTDAVGAICARNNIHCVNLFVAFMQNQKENLFFKGHDIHWTDAGQDVAAGETASYIVNNMLAKREP